jgi:hypothetical protein
MSLAVLEKSLHLLVTLHVRYNSRIAVQPSHNFCSDIHLLRALR